MYKQLQIFVAVFQCGLKTTFTKIFHEFVFYILMSDALASTQYINQLINVKLFIIKMSICAGDFDFPENMLD